MNEGYDDIETLGNLVRFIATLKRSGLDTTAYETFAEKVRASLEAEWDGDSRAVGEILDQLEEQNQRAGQMLGGFSEGYAQALDDVRARLA